MRSLCSLFALLPLALACESNPPLATCGDGALGPGETCDDGNAVSGDGCSASCLREGPDGSVFDPGHPLHGHLGPAGTMAPFTDRDEFGTFRIKCGLSHVNYDDPIVFPGAPGAAHLHTYFGHAAADHSLTVDNARDHGVSTCQGGPLNMSAYWIPTVLRPLYARNEDGSYQQDASGEFVPNGEYRIVFPVDSWELDGQGVPMRGPDGELIGTDNNGPDVYYKRGVPGDVVPPPIGLRMIAGQARATPDDPQHPTVMRWTCHDERNAAGQPQDQSPTIPRCAPGRDPGAAVPWRVHFGLFFPPCWDGVNLDSDDHASHMHYPVYDEASNTFSCPASHPVAIPQVSYQIYYPVTEDTVGPYGDTRDWFLSSDSYDAGPETPGGASGHGDWFMAWEPETAETWTRFCIVEERKCTNGDLGNGFRLESQVPGVGNSAGHPIVNRGRGR